MAEAAAKRAKLEQLNTFRRKLPHCSASALSAMLELAEREGIPELHSRKHMRESRDQVCNEETPFGPVTLYVDMVDDSNRTKRIAVAHPLSYFWTALVRSNTFSAYIADRLRKFPCTPETPWHIIMYSDEVTPGNVIAPKNARKFQTVLWSFQELGCHALAHEEAWFPCLITYSSRIKELSGGMSQAFRRIINLFFNADGHNMSTGGIRLPSGQRLWADLGLMLQDGDAHVQAWSVRGCRGSKVCLLCNNVFTTDSDICAEDGTRLLASEVIQEKDMVKATDSELRNNMRFLAGQTRSPDFTLLQQALGLTYHEHSLLMDASLDDVVRPTKQYVHDWMHTLVANGIYNICVCLTLEAAIENRQHNVYELLRGFIQHWRWPSKLHTTDLHDIFTATRKQSHRKANHIKAQASDMLTLAPVIAYFVQSILLPSAGNEKCTNACRTLLALSDVLGFISHANRGI